MRVNPEFNLPGADGKIISRKGARVDRNDFRAVMDEYYATRGWDVGTGLFCADGLKELGLGDMLPELAAGGFVA